VTRVNGMVKYRSVFLYPISIVYGLITGFKNLLYNMEILKSVEFRIPVICIGNITVGGTGKTPHTEYIAGLLKNSFTVATLSRGYKRKSKGFVIATPLSEVSDIGDEPLQMSRKLPDVMVTVDRNRVNGINNILKINPQTEVILLDDAFQHRRVKPGFNILLSDFERLMINDLMLPYGNLREHVSNMRRADIILITKCPDDISPIQRRIIVKDINKAPYQNLFFTTFGYGTPRPVFHGIDQQTKLTENPEAGIVLVTGIANPEPLKQYLSKSYKEIIDIRFSDHHQFSEKDFDLIESALAEIKSPIKFVLTTEKDAVRLREFTNIAESFEKLFYYIPVSINFLNDDKDEFDNLLIEYVRKNKRNNRVSEI